MIKYHCNIFGVMKKSNLVEWNKRMTRLLECDEEGMSWNQSVNGLIQELIKKYYGRSVEELGNELIGSKTSCLLMERYLMSEEISHGDPRYEPSDEDDLDRHLENMYDHRRMAKESATSEINKFFAEGFK